MNYLFIAEGIVVQVELGSKLEEQLAHGAASQGVTLDEYLRETLEEKAQPAAAWDAEQQARHEAAVDALRDFASKHKFTLGAGLSMRDLIDEGRH